MKLRAISEGMSADEYWEKIGGRLDNLADAYGLAYAVKWEIYPGDNKRMGPGLEMKVGEDLSSNEPVSLDSPEVRQLAKAILRDPALRKEFPYVLITFVQLEGEIIEIWPDPI